MSTTDYGKIIDDYVEKTLEAFTQESINRGTVKGILWMAMLPLFIRLNRSSKTFDDVLKNLDLEHHTREGERRNEVI